MKIRLPTGDVAFLPGADEATVKQHERFLKARYDFAIKYAAEKGWGTDVDHLTLEQILEIRRQPSWLTPIEGEEPLRVNGTFVRANGQS
jgi:hypothetical protein